MDKVFILDLCVPMVIGVYEWEKKIEQPLYLDIEMLWDQTKAAESDYYNHALCYEKISNVIRSFLQEKPVELIETVAEKVAQLILCEFHVPVVKVIVKKPTALEQARTVGVEILRGDVSLWR